MEGILMTNSRKKGLALLLVLTMLAGLMPTSLAAEELNYEERWDGVYVDSSLLDVTVENDNYAIHLEVGETLALNVGTTPSTVTKLAACGACNGGLPSPFGNCGDFCPDEWGYCQCGTNTVTLTPYVVMKEDADSQVAQASLSAGVLTLKGIENGLTRIALQGILTYANNFNSKYDNRYTEIKYVTITVGTGFSPPRNIVAEPGFEEASLKWDPVGNLASYSVYQTTTPESFALFLENEEENGLTPEAVITDGTAAYAATGLTNNTTYYFMVLAQSTEGEKAYSEIVSATPLSAPEAPRAEGFTESSNSIGIRWEPVDRAEGYRIYYSPTSNVYGDPDAILAGSATSYVKNGLADNKSYYFKVEAYNAGGSALSSEVTAKSVAQAANLVVAADEKTVLLSWGQSAGATAYNVYQTTAPGIYGDPVAVVATTSYISSNLDNDTTYYYKIAGINEYGKGTSSSEVSATPYGISGEKWKDNASESFAGGAGTAEEPYLIGTAEELAYFAKLVNEGTTPAVMHFKLTGDIDLEGRSWTPAGNMVYPFNGIFDGNGFVIKNLGINEPKGSYKGFFGYTRNATVENVGLLNANITGDAYVGGLIGYAAAQTVVTGTFATGSVKGTNNVGGLIGYMYNTSVDTSFASAHVTLDSSNGGYFGGFVGYAEGTGSKFENTYTTSTLARPSDSGSRGGFAGYMRQLGLTNVYSAAEFEDNIYYLTSGIASQVSSMKAPSGLYFMNDTIGSAAYTGTLAATGLPASAMTRDNVAAGMPTLDYINVWTPKDNNGDTGYYPQLRVFAESSNPAVREASLESAATKAYYRVELNVPEDAATYIRWATPTEALNSGLVKAGYGLDWYTDSEFTQGVSLAEERFNSDGSVLYGKWSSRSTDTSLSSSEALVSLEDKSLALTYGTSYESLMSSITVAGGATFGLYSMDGVTPVYSLSKNYKLYVTAEDKVTLTAYSLIYPSVQELTSSAIKSKTLFFEWDEVVNTGYRVSITYPNPSGSGNMIANFNWYGENDPSNVLTQDGISLAVHREEGRIYGVLSNLTDNVIYKINVAPISKAMGLGNATPNINVTPLPPPGSPENLFVQVVNGAVKLSWEPSQTAQSYSLFMRTLSEAYPEEPIATAIEDTSYELEDLSGLNTVAFAVTAINAYGESIKSKEAILAPFKAPNPPEGLTASTVDNLIRLNWSPAEGAVLYKIYMGTARDQVNTVRGSVTGNTAFDIAGLEYGEVYYFAVASQNPAGEGIKSRPIEVELLDASLEVPRIPENLSAAVSGDVVRLSWNPAEGAESYSVYIGNAPDTYISTPLAKGITQNYYDVENLEKDSTYYFAVTASNNAGESGKSFTVSAALTEEEPEEPVENEDEEAAGVVGYAVSTNHGGEAVNGTDQQYVLLDIFYDRPLFMEDPEATLAEMKISFSANSNTHVLSLGEDGKSLHLEIHFPFAAFSGELKIEALNKDAKKLETVLDSDGKPVDFPEVSLLVPNGVTLQTVGQTAGTQDEAASVTKKVIAPQASTRGMVHMLFLKNGRPVGTLNAYGGNIIGHYHNYLSLNAEAFAAMIPGSWFNNAAAFKDNYVMTASGDTVTITALEPEEGEVLDLLLIAYPRDRAANTDKSTLNEALRLAQAENLPDFLKTTALKQETAKAKALVNSSLYFQNEVNEAAERLNTLMTYRIRLMLEAGEEWTTLSALYNEPLSPESPVRSGYRFTGWFLDAALETPAELPLIPWSESLTLYAGWERSQVSAGTVTSGTNVTPEPIITAVGKKGTLTGLAKITASYNTRGNASVQVPEAYIAQALAALKAVEESSESAGARKTIEIQISAARGTATTPGAVTVGIPASAVSLLLEEQVKALTLVSSVGAITLDEKVLSLSERTSDGNLVLSLSKEDTDGLPSSVRERVGDSPVYSLSLVSGGIPITDFQGGTARVTLDYALQEGEDPNRIIMYYLDEEGALKTLSASSYDAAGGKVTFVTGHFSLFSMGYGTVNLTDISGWYGDAVNFLSARGIISGADNGLFRPEKGLTRAELVQMLAVIAEADKSLYTGSSFTDVANDKWYLSVVEWAYQNGIAFGYDGKFNPDAIVSRQELAVLLARFAGRFDGYTPAERETEAFTDLSLISEYAVYSVELLQEGGILAGDTQNRFNPQEGATRAEAAQMLALLIKDILK